MRSMRGLKAAGVRTPDQDTVLEFEVAACYEMKKMTAKALEFYQKAARQSPGTGTSAIGYGD